MYEIVNEPNLTIAFDMDTQLSPNVLQFSNKKESLQTVRLFFCTQFLFTIIL